VLLMNNLSVSQSEPELDVIFVHGLGSDAGGWVNRVTNFDWPVELGERNARLRTMAVEYYAPMMGHQAVSPSYQALAIKLFDDLTQRDVGTRPIVFVAHSLGGIMVKQLLRHAEAKKHKIFKQTRTVIFLSTPHSGATIATLGGHLGSAVKFLGQAVATFLPAPVGVVVDAAAQVAAWQVRISDLTSQLQKEQPSLLDLNLWYRTLRHIDTRVYYETNSFYAVLIVDPLSADPGVYGCDPVRAEGKDHITISKPRDENDDLYKAVAAITENVRKRERQGKGYPVLHEWIRESLRDTEFKNFRDIGRFEEIPSEFRSRVEFRLRDQFRQRIKNGETFDMDAASKSEFNIDRFAVSLWLRVLVKDQLDLLKDNFERAQGDIRSDLKPKTLIPLYRAARTLDQVLIDFNFADLGRLMAYTIEVLEIKRKADPGFDGSGATRQLLRRLEGHLEGFAKVKSDLATDPKYRENFNPDVSDSLGQD
jgi:pimeloyl-ACP methyl ester carboxylesterase